MSTPKRQSLNRRGFLSAVATTGAAAGAFALFAPAANAAQAPSSPNAQPGRSSALTAEKGSIHVSQTARTTTAAAFGPLKQIDAGELSVGYAEAGPADGPPVILLHGWPYDIHSFAEVTPLLAASGYRVLVPYLRGYGTTRFLSKDTPRNAQQAALALDSLAFMDALNIQKAVLGGFDWGARTADIIAALWPERVKALVAVSGYLIGSREANKKPLPPQAEWQWWYQFYFATERGRAGYEANRHNFNKLIWQIASPKWDFDDATFDRTAASFDNPDHAAIVIHNYRWRISVADGDPRFDDLELRLAEAPVITVPTVTLQGDADGAPRPDPASYAAKFTGTYEHRTVMSGIGHNLPQEAPQAFAQAIIDVDRL
jgi:pimeloyl-ACP methyl ester carboxylesterase